MSLRQLVNDGGVLGKLCEQVVAAGQLEVAKLKAWRYGAAQQHVGVGCFSGRIHGGRIHGGRIQDGGLLPVGPPGGSPPLLMQATPQA